MLSVSLSGASTINCAATLDKIYKIECDDLGSCECIRRSGEGEEIERISIGQCVRLGVDNAITNGTMDKFLECCQEDDERSTGPN